MIDLDRLAARSAAGRIRLWHAGFRPAGWAALARRAERRAVAEVPLYRERWAAGDAGPLSVVDLAGQLERLCPLAFPWRPDREPSLWGGRPAALRTALALAGFADPGMPVLEVRRSLVEWRRLGPAGPPYGVLLGDDADVASPARRTALEVPAAALAARAGGAVVVGAPGETGPAAARLRQALDDPTLRLAEVHRARTLLYDPYLGYFGAVGAGCGEHHLDWTRYHARPTPTGIALTALRQRRPTLIAVLPAEPGFAAVARCPRHRSPVLVR